MIFLNNFLKRKKYIKKTHNFRVDFISSNLKFTTYVLRVKLYNNNTIHEICEILKNVI